MIEALTPPPIPDHFRNQNANELPGKTPMHPLQIYLKKLGETQAKRQYDMNALLYGHGFADKLEDDRKIMENVAVTYTSYSKPSNLGMDLITGNIDELDFNDSFAPNGMSSSLEFDSHEIQEKRFFQ